MTLKDFEKLAVIGGALMAAGKAAVKNPMKTLGGLFVAGEAGASGVGAVKALNKAQSTAQRGARPGATFTGRYG